MRPVASCLKVLVLAAFLLPAAVSPLFAASPAESLKVIDTIAIPDGPWDYAAIDPATRTLLVARGDGVMTIELATRKVTPTLVTGQRVHGVLAIPGTPLGLSANGTSNTATLFRIADGRVIAEIPTGAKPDAAIFDPSSGLVLVMNGKSGDATLIDPGQAKSVGTIQIGGALEFAVADGAGHVFVNIEDRGELATIDVAKRTVTSRLALKGCEEPTGLAYDPETKALVSACANNVAKVISAATGAEIATLPIAKGPDAVIWDKTRKLFLIPCGKDGVITAIAATSATEFTVAGQIATHSGARTGALDDATGRLYLPAANFENAAAGQRPAIVPGSVAIIVVGE